ncbi:MAG: hypothetical protein KDD62_02840 [Bdellovibrionales bacterium]|nr:hypothetical protein [Bdellovibrionales bacterium]
MELERDRSCGLCRDLDSPTVLLETEHFTTLPGLGQFSMEGGYLLTITKEHRYTSSAGFSQELFDELEQVMNEAAGIVKQVYDVDPLFFEHGSTCHTKAGQCVTHMHMNLVPYDLDLSRFLRPDRIRTLDHLSELQDIEPPYLYVRTPEGKHLATPVGDLSIPSQYLRSAIGVELGHPERSFWDWRVRRAIDEGCDDEEAIENTVKALKDPFHEMSLRHLQGMED